MAKGLNVEIRKWNKYNRILNLIRTQGPLSRAQIRRTSGYSANTVLRGVETLLNEGFVCEPGIGRSGGGRPPSLLRLNPQGGYFIGVEFYAGKITAATVDIAGAFISSRECLLDRNLTPEAILGSVTDTIRQTSQSITGKGNLLGIGIGVPGQIDRERGISIAYDLIANWHDIPIRDTMAAAFNVPVYIENNVRVMALAHRWLSPMETPASFMFLCIRSGIAMAVVNEGMIVTGASNLAGEIGHIAVPGARERCICGNTGCLVTEVCNDALVARMRALTGPGPQTTPCATITDFIAGVRAGNRGGREIVESAARSLGGVLGHAVAMVNPAYVFVWGDITACGDLFLDALGREVRHNAPPESCERLRMAYSPWGADFGAIGAATLVMHEEFGIRHPEVLPPQAWPGVTLSPGSDTRSDSPAPRS